MVKLNRRRMRILLRRALHTADSPRRTAAAFALGVFLGFSPFFGVHTLAALGLAFLLRLNRLAVLFGTFVLNPWTVVPIYGGGMTLGFWTLGQSTEAFPDLPFGSVRLTRPETIVALLDGLQPVLFPFLIGNLTLALVASAVSFPVVLWAVSRYRARRSARRQRISPQAASSQ